MLDLKRVRKAGLGANDSTWLTRLLRRLIWPIVRPYFERLVIEIQRKPQPPAPVRDDGWKKDFIAVAHRLSSIEETLGDRHKMAEDIAALSVQLRSIEAAIPEVSLIRSLGSSEPARYSQLTEGAAVALPGTALLLSSGKFGRFLLRHPDTISAAILRGEFWDEHLKAVIQASGSPGRVAIDAGAYFGFHSVYLSRHFAEVYSFEPQKPIFEMLCANILLNDRRNVHAFNMALYDRSCHMRLAPPSKQEISVPSEGNAPNYDLIRNAAALMFEETDAVTEGTVHGRTIDSLGLGNVGLIKVDTQGADLQVLKGASQTIKHCRPTIVFEFEKHLTKLHGAELTDYEKFFEAAGYELAILANRGDGKQVDYLATPRQRS